MLPLAAAALLLAQPARATSCDERAIAVMSVEEAAEMIWERSDVIGFGYVETVDTPEREQQFIDLVVAMKGASRSYDYAPLRIGRVGWVGPGSYRLPARPGEIVFVTLLRTERGYIVPACRSLLLARNGAALIRRLAAMARERN
jgi:hypothetical protein